jgi:predicted NBD/HSP70 family sugar kinase
VAKSKVKIKHDAIAACEAELVRCLRLHGKLSRVQLARALNLAPSTVGIYVDRLVREGFLAEATKAETEFGRPPTLLSPSNRRGQFIGIDVESRNVLASSLDFSLNPITQLRYSLGTRGNARRVLETIDQAIEQLVDRDDRELLGIGVGIPGPVDTTRGIGLYYEFIDGWENVALADRLQKRFKVPVHLENNTHSMALAELWSGQGRGVENFICIGARGGIAAGIVVGGQLYRGANNLAGRIGGWPVNDARRRNDGKSDRGPRRSQRLEDIVSVRSILESLSGRRGQNGRSTSADQSEVEFQTIVEAAQQGDVAVGDVLNRAAETLGAAISQWNLLLNPRKVILAAPIAALEQQFIEPVRETVASLSPAHDAHLPEIVGSELGEFIGTLGAGALAAQHWKPNRE